jgi:hypothetical protein
MDTAFLVNFSALQVLDMRTTLGALKKRARGADLVLARRFVHAAWRAFR